MIPNMRWKEVPKKAKNADYGNANPRKSCIHRKDAPTLHKAWTKVHFYKHAFTKDGYLRNFFSPQKHMTMQDMQSIEATIAYALLYFIPIHCVEWETIYDYWFISTCFFS